MAPPPRTNQLVKAVVVLNKENEQVKELYPDIVIIDDKIE